MSKADEFIEAYKILEANVRFAYHLKDEESIVTALKKQMGFAKHIDKIQSCANLRNYYQHTAKVNNVFAAEPMDEAIQFLHVLSEMVRKRPKCKDVCIKLNEIYWRAPSDNVRDAMRVMKKNMYTCVPILVDGIVTGIFDENSLFSYISENLDDIFEVGENCTFQDIAEHLSLEGREMEEFEFVSMNRYVDDVTALFEKRFNCGKRLGLILLTNTGKSTEPLQGIITPWDIINLYSV